VSRGARRNSQVVRLASYGNVDNWAFFGPISEQPEQVILDGYLQVPLREEYEFLLRSYGTSVKLAINEQAVAVGGKLPTKVALHGGYNRIRIELIGGPRSEDGALRLTWAKVGEPLA